MSPHTPTPWVLEQEEQFPWDLRIRAGDVGILTMRRACHSSRDKTLADVMACRDHGKSREDASRANHEQLANAKHIVRAVNCHEDLVNVVKTLIAIAPDSVEYGDWPELREAVEWGRTVLARAEKD